MIGTKLFILFPLWMSLLFVVHWMLSSYSRWRGASEKNRLISKIYTYIKYQDVKNYVLNSLVNWALFICLSNTSHSANSFQYVSKIGCWCVDIATCWFMWKSIKSVTIGLNVTHQCLIFSEN
jgi:hypothetical protein